MYIDHLYPSLSTSGSKANVPINLPGHTIEFMIDLSSVRKALTPLALRGANELRKAGRAWMDPKDPVSTPNSLIGR